MDNSKQEQEDPFKSSIGMVKPEFSVKVMEPRRVEALLQRIHSHSLKLPELEANYVIFDILFWEGEDWRQKHLRQRLDLLEDCIPSSERFHRINTFTDGASLLERN